MPAIVMLISRVPEVLHGQDSGVPQQPRVAQCQLNRPPLSRLAAEGGANIAEVRGRSAGFQRRCTETAKEYEARHPLLESGLLSTVPLLQGRGEDHVGWSLLPPEATAMAILPLITALFLLALISRHDK